MASVEDIISWSEELADEFELWDEPMTLTPIGSDLPIARYVAIVGSTNLSVVQKVWATRYIHMIFSMEQAEQGEGQICVVSGGAEGIDILVEDEAEKWGILTDIYRSEKKGWYWYKKRNELIAQRCDVLYRIYTEQSKTYGSGWTRDRATELGKETYPICLPVG